MKRIRELKERKAKLIKDARAILDKADGEKRRLSTEEREQQNKMFAEIEDLDGEIRQAELDAELEDRGTPLSDGLGASLQPGRGESVRGQNLSRPVLVMPNGQEIRAYSPNEAMADQASKLSLGRLIRAHVVGDWSAAQDELRAIGTTGSGGYLVPSSISGTVIDLARAKSVFVAAGGWSFPMPTAEHAVVRVASGVTPQWRQENETISESDPAFEQIVLRARSLAALCRVSREQIQDAPNASQVIEQELSLALASELDRAALLGLGSTGEPLGIYHTSGINEVSMGENGATPTNYDKYLDAIYEVENDNGEPNAVIYSPRTAKTLRKLKTGLSSDNTTLQPPEEYKQLTRLVTTAIGNDFVQGTEEAASVAILGDFKQAAIGIRLGLEIEVGYLSDTFAKNQVGIRAIMRADVVVFRETHFCRIVGITA